eukprot:TRINITY_DN66833_c4_g1_i2.p1 TRINITY_DN66833_c4_g1~~TRINITY_DN66833_c4_g1_i2.p1  ORF type:complete len:290 (-),score=15.96 TRINITY_DN66833_c4_g1_i2:1135-2004(-)
MCHELPKTATYLLTESYQADTTDREDHTFCGIMFDVRCQTELPVDYIQIQEVWVRGALGSMGVYTCDDTYASKDKEQWTQVYEGEHKPSERVLVPLKLTTPIQLRPGEGCGLYIHSKTPGDEGLVYDNQTRMVTHKDNYLRILPGMAHLSNKPFGRTGYWGFGWRSNRQFVGRLTYGIKWFLWRPEPTVFYRFPRQFQDMSVLLCWVKKQEGSTIEELPWDCLFFMLNFCRYNWLGDPETLKIGDEEEEAEEEEEEEESDEDGELYHFRPHLRWANTRGSGWSFFNLSA